MTDTEIKKLWIYCQELFGKTFEIPDHEARRDVKLIAWQDVLGDLDAGLVRRAIAGSGSHFALTPMEIRQAALELAGSETGHHERDADEALLKLYQLIVKWGWPRPDEAIAEAAAWSPALGVAIRAIGWAEVCADEEPGVFRGQFRRIYEQAAIRTRRDAEPLAPVLALARDLELTE